MRKKEGLILLLLLLGVLLVWGSIRAEAAEEPEEETVPEAKGMDRRDGFS